MPDLPQSSDKPRVYWQDTWHEDQDPDDACWYVRIGNAAIGIGTWEQAFRYAFVYAAAMKAGILSSN